MAYDKKPLPKEQDPKFYEEELPTRDDEVAICRVLVADKVFPSNSKGDRISMDPQQAQFYKDRGYVLVEVSKVKPSEIAEAGNVEEFLLKNPKRDKLTPDTRSKLIPIPGLPTKQDAAKPWDHIVVPD